MSTGLGVIMYGGPVPFANGLADANVNGVSNCLVFKADRNFVITHIVLSNASGAAINARVAMTPGGVATAAADSRKVANFTVAAGNIVDWATRVPLLQGFGLIFISNTGFGDAILYGGITGEQLD